MGGGGVGLGDGLGDIRRTAACTAQVETVGGEIHRPQLHVGLEHELVSSHGNAEHAGRLGTTFVHDQGSGQHHQVRAVLQVPVHELVVESHLQFPILAGHLGPPFGIVFLEAHSRLAGAPVIILVALAVDLYIVVEYLHLGLGEELLYGQGVLDGGGAAYTGAVGYHLSPGPHALDHHHFLDILVLPLLEGELQLFLGHDVVVRPVAVEALRLQLVGPGGHHDGAHLYPGVLAGLVQDHQEVAVITVYAVDPGVEVDGEVLGLLHSLAQLLYDLHRLAVLGKDIVQAAQHTSQLRLLLHQVYVESLAGDGQGCGHPGHPSPDDHGGGEDIQLDLLLGLQEGGPGHSHAHQVLGLLGGLVPLLHVHPGALVPDIGELEEVLVQSRLLAGLAEEGLVGPGGARCHKHPVELMLLDGILDGGQPVLGAGIEVVLSVDHVGQGGGVLGHRRHVQEAPDVGAAVAYEGAYPQFLFAFLLLPFSLLLRAHSLNSRGN